LLTPIEKFRSVMRRCGILMGRFEVLESLRVSSDGGGVSHEEQCDLIRAAVVLAVSGMDSYFTDKFSSMVVPYLRKNGSNASVVRLMSDAGLDTAKALELVTLDRPFRRIHAMVDSHLSRYTTQSVGAINELFVCFGLKQYVQNAANRTHKKSILKSVTNLIQRRHQIVHDADMNSRGKIQSIVHKKVQNQILTLSDFVESCDFLADQALVPKKTRMARKTTTRRAATTRTHGT
jgi:hypothetical protein